MRMLATITSVAVLIAGGVDAQETFITFEWEKLQTADTLPGEVIPADADTPFARLRTVSEDDAGKTIEVLRIPDPGITAERYALVGQVRCEDVQGRGYLEMLSRSEDGNESFSRTLAGSGPQAALRDTTDWRRFVLPFQLGPEDNAPSLIRFNVVLPATGVVELGPVQLMQYAGLAGPTTPTGAWWSDQSAGLFGGLAGTGIGVLGALIGILASCGRGRSVVVSICGLMIIGGVVTLAAGVFALLRTQPYAVYYPLLLGGVLCTILPAALLPTIRRRYQELELRRMNAMDA